MQSSTDGLEKCATPRATAARICALVHVCPLHISALVCLFVFFSSRPPHPRHQNSRRKDGRCECLRRHGAHERRQSGSGKYNSYVLQLGLRSVYVCASMCDRFLTSLGLRSFPALTNTWKKNNKNKQNGFRSCLEGLAKESSADQYKRLALQLKIIDSLPIRVFPNHYAESSTVITRSTE